MPDKKSIEAAVSLIKVDSTKILGLRVGALQVTPGLQVPKAEAKEVPTLSLNVTSGTYIVVGIDLDAPFPSFPILGPILHWIQPGLTPEPSAEGASKLVSTSPFVADYAPPGPPPPSTPHRYVFLLYEQPEDFDASKYAPAEGKKMGMMPRMRFDLDTFAKEIKLGSVVACNYFNSN